MGERTAISWADHTFNPWVGCTKVSPACDGCYAEEWAKRFGRPELWTGERSRTSDANWRQPHRWNRAARDAGVRRRVFCASLADVFDNAVPDVWRRDLWETIYEMPDLDWLLLTKRPGNIYDMRPVGWGVGWPNVWLGTTAENQREADRRLPHLLRVPAALHFVSCEPLLGRVNLERVEVASGVYLDALGGDLILGDGPDAARHSGDAYARLGWVIAGGESGPGARPMHPDWARLLREQCDEAGVPFHFKQWREHWPAELLPAVRTGRSEPLRTQPDNVPRWSLSELGKPDLAPVVFQRFGKSRTGRFLDGREHLAVPGAAP